MGEIIREATVVGRYDQPPLTSALYAHGNCILLALYRLIEDEDLYSTFCEIATGRPLGGKILRSYRECVDFTRCAELAHVDAQCLKIGGNISYAPTVEMRIPAASVCV